MPTTVLSLTTTASITGSKLISNADEQLNTLINDVETYAETTYKAVATNLEGTVGIHVATASNFASEVQRTNQLIPSLQDYLRLTNAQVDTMFIEARRL